MSQDAPMSDPQEPKEENLHPPADSGPLPDPPTTPPFDPDNPKGEAVAALPKRKRGRPSNAERAARAAAEAALGIKVVPAGSAKLAPPDGFKRKDRWYFAQQMAKLNAAQNQALDDGQGGLRGYDAMLKGIMAEASFNGVDPQAIMDGRTDEERQYEAIKIFADKAPEIFEIAEPMLDAMVGLMDQIDLLMDDAHTEMRNTLFLQEEELERAARAGKRMRSLIHRLREVRERVRRPHPPGRRKLSEVPNEAQKAGQVLRFMAYVMRAGDLGSGEPPTPSDSPPPSNAGSSRSKKAKSSTAPGLTFLQFKLHHAKMAWTVFLTKNRAAISPDHYLDYVNVCEYEGAIIVIPPGHGKTTYTAGWLGQEFCLDPHLRVMYGHAQEDQACKTLNYVANFFKLDNGAGRRREALYPGLSLDRCNDHEFRFKLKEKNREMSMRAHGMNAKVGGGDADIVVLDDNVDPAEREQPEERRRKCVKTETWMHRLRKKRSYHLTICTLWHPEDANMQRINKAKAGSINVGTLILRCGGPEPIGQTGKWATLWPEVWPVVRLKQRYAGDESLYLATFCSDPRPESHQIIRKLRFFDPESDQHQEFLRGATIHLTVDPAATAKKHSDKSGMLQVACGELVGDKDGKLLHERRARLIYAERIFANIADLKQSIANFCMKTRVDRVHIETQAAFVALADSMKEEYGVDVTQHTAGNRSKEIRLRAVGIFLDDTRPTPEHGGAVMEFPGIRVHGKDEIQPDPKYFWLYEQFLRFGATNEDDAVDALTQLLAYFARVGDLVAGQGWVTAQVRNTVLAGADDRVRKVVKRWLKSQSQEDETVELQDYRFANCGRPRELAWN